jgi:diguanylate cyclase (GGDEF)-like protein/PAS domain S-box-containing protein
MKKNIIQQFDDLIVNPLPAKLGIFTRYLIVLSLVGISFIIGLAEINLKSIAIIFLTFSPAVTLSAMLGGFFPGLFSAVISTALAQYLIFSQTNISDAAFTPEIISSSLIFFAEELTVVVAIGILHRNYYKALRNTNSLELLGRQPKIDNLFRQFFELPFIGMAITDPVTKKWIRFNDRLCEITGYTRQELEQKTWLEITHPDDLEENLLKFENILNGTSDEYQIDKKFIKKDGSLVFVRIDEKCIRTGNGKVEYLIKTVEDITQQKKAEETIQKNEEILRSTLDVLPVGVWIMDENGKIHTGNPAGRSVWAGARYVGVEQFGEYKGWWLHNRELIKPHEWAAARAIEKGETTIEEEIEIECFDGSHKIILNSAMPFFNKEGKITGAVIVNQDITSRKENENKIYNMAFYDSLTQLPNRRLLFDRLEVAMTASKRSGKYSAMMFLDLDGFKKLNDAHGHDIGDFFLIEVSQRIRHCVRESDTVGRLGGDEFVVILSELDKEKEEAKDQVMLVAEKIRSVLSIPFMLKLSEEKNEIKIEHQSGSSIGVVLFRNHSASQEELLKWADMAMYEAKQAGGNTARFKNY